MMTKILLIIFILQNVYLSHCIFNNALKKLKQKSKEAFKKKFGKDKSWNFLGYDPTEFPGTNADYRQTNRKKWEDYYNCLELQNSNIGQEFSKTPEALQAFVSTSVNPKEAEKIDSIQWYWSKREDKKKFTLVDFTENVLLSPDGSLQMFNLQQDQTGQYMCRIGDEEAPSNFLTIIDIPDSELLEVHPIKSPEGPYPLNPEIITNLHLILDTEWTPWSNCNKCNQIGRRHRIGHCIVKYQENNNLTKTEKISNEEYELLRIFKFGIPCSSHVLPTSIKKLNELKNRKTELMTGFCKISCTENKVFEVRDKNGKVIERANNTAGIYSLLQEIPAIQPSVARMLQYAEKGKETNLKCPGNLNSDIPIQWHIGPKKLIPELLVKESQGRLYISITDKIVIKNTKLTDTNVYSCWQLSELAGTVRLIVEKKISLNFNHHIMLFGAVSIFSVILYIFIRAFFQKRKAKTET